MEQNLAKTLFEEGGIFIFLDVPIGTEIGIDMKSWNTEERFRGIKMIPPGIHYIFYSSVNNEGDVAPRSGFFYNFRKGEIIVRKWDSKLDDISDERFPEEEISHFRQNIKTLDSFLGPYPYDIHEKWINLTKNLTAELVDQLMPLCGIVRSALELEGCSDADRPRLNQIENSAKIRKRIRLSSCSNYVKEDELLPEMKPKAGSELRTTEFSERHYPEGASPSDITLHSLDSSYVLESMVSKYKQPTDIIGEMEFNFICFLVGHSLEAFEQWKRLLNLFCSCQSALKKFRRLYDLLLNILQVQIVEIPEEFLADIVSNNNFVYVKMRDLFRNIKNSNLDGQLKSKMNRFKEELTSLFSWDFEHLDSEDEEDAPVIVNIEGY